MKTSKDNDINLISTKKNKKEFICYFVGVVISLIGIVVMIIADFFIKSDFFYFFGLVIVNIAIIFIIVMLVINDKKINKIKNIKSINDLNDVITEIKNDKK